MQSVKQKTSFDAFHPSSQYLDAIAFAIGMTDACIGPSTYLVNHLRWAADGSQAVTYGISEAMDNDVFAEVRMKPFVQRIGR